MTDPDVLWTWREVAHYAQVSRPQAYALMKQMPHIVLGVRGIRVRPDDFWDFLRRRTEKPASVRKGK